MKDTFFETAERYIRLFPGSELPDSRGMAESDFLKLEDLMISAIKRGTPITIDDLEVVPVEPDPEAGLLL